MLTNVEFNRFRGFEKLSADLAPHAYVVGPNSAGKSTILEAIALAERCLQRARRQRPLFDARDRGEFWRAYPLPSIEEGEGEDPVRFDFGTSEASAVIRWGSGASLHMVWPVQDDDRDPGFFYLEGPGQTLVGHSEVAKLFTASAVLPVVTPLDRIEEIKDGRYIRQQSWTRLASRHFRNHALVMQRDGEWDKFKAFGDDWLPEIHLLDVVLDAGANRLGVFYSEPGSRIPKELAWAGDGIQIWVQLLWHLYRAQASETIVLDEPDVYLHPDLQRRLVRLLDSTGAQIILASHSADVVAEAPADGVLWVDRRQGVARRAVSRAALSALSASLGSSYNLYLARTTRAQLVIATDCHDVRVLRSLARHVGALGVADELRVSVIQLQDIPRWAGTERIGQMLRDALSSTLPAVILLQGGQRTRAGDELLRQQLAAPNNTVTIWERAELENYVLDPDALGRACGGDAVAIGDRMAAAMAQMESDARSAFAANCIRCARDGNARAALEEAEQRFDQLWERPENHVKLVRGTDVISVLNEWTEREGYKLIQAYRVAKLLPPHAVPAEVFNVLLAIDDLVI